MNHNNPEPSAQRTATRAPVGKPIKLHFDDSLEAAEGVCENISIGGMFILVESTRKSGSLVRFELRVDESTAIRGLGEVVWAQGREEALRRESGVGIKFRFLEQRDRQLIFKLVSQHIKERLAKRHSLDENSGEPPGLREQPLVPPAPSSPEALVTPAIPTEAAGTPTPVEPRAEVLSEVDLGGSFDAELDSLRENPAWTVDERPPTPAGRLPEEPREVDDSVSVRRSASYIDDPPAEAPGDLANPPEAIYSDPPADALEQRSESLDTGRLESGLEASAPDPEALHAGEIEPDRYQVDLYPAKRRLSLPLLAVALVVIVASALFLLRDTLFGGGRARAEDGVAVTPPAGSVNPTGEATAPPATLPPASAAQDTGEAPPSAPVEIPVAEAPPPPAPLPAAEATRPDFSRVLDIGWQRAGQGIEVVIETDGNIPDGSFRHFRLGGENPREVIRLLGIRRRYDRGEIRADGTLLNRVRTGFHEKRGGNELHVVLDLADLSAQVQDVRAEGSRLIVTVGRP